MSANVVYSDAALQWMGAALYAIEFGNKLALLPRFEELPERLRLKWIEQGRGWLEAIVPLLEVK